MPAPRAATSGSWATPLAPAPTSASPTHLIGPGGRGGTGGGAGRSERPLQPLAAARVPAGSRRAPAEAMRAALPCPLGSDTSCALLTPEKERRLATAGRVQGPRAQGRRWAVAPLPLFLPGRPGSLELKPLPLLPQLPVPPRHAVAMARNLERGRGRGPRGLSGDVVSPLWRERALEGVFEKLQRWLRGASSPGKLLAESVVTDLVHKHRSDFLVMSTAYAVGLLNVCLRDFTIFCLVYS